MIVHFSGIGSVFQSFLFAGPLRAILTKQEERTTSSTCMRRAWFPDMSEMGLDPLFMSVTLFKHRRFEECVKICDELLEKNPKDQVCTYYVIMLHNSTFGGWSNGCFFMEQYNDTFMIIQHHASKSSTGL